MPVYYDNVDVLVNGSGIMADNVSVETKSSVEPIYQLGRKGIIGQFPQGPITSNFGISYICELNNEPNYEILHSIKSQLDNVTWTGVTLSVAGITGYNCFLESYSLRAIPNSLIKSNVSYVSFELTSGTLQEKPKTTQYNSNNNIAHSWTTFLLGTGTYLQIPTYEFSYSFKANWEPIYIIGNRFPTQVFLRNIEESLSFTRDRYFPAHFSGENITGAFFNYTGSDFNISLLNLSLASGGETGIYGALYFNIRNAMIKNVQLSAEPNNIAKVSTEAFRYY